MQATLLAQNREGYHPVLDGGGMADSVYRHPHALWHQITDVLHFYYPKCIDHVHGGYILQLDEDDGHIYDAAPRHLVSTSRMIFNFCVGDAIGGPDWCRAAANHGLIFLLETCYDPEHDGFAWLLDGRDVVDAERHCYGHVFALLATAAAAKIGLPRGEQALRDVVAILEARFKDKGTPLYLDRCSPTWEPHASRGQNANMHACEAFLLAYEAIGEERYLQRAYDIATEVADRLAGKAEGRIWEYYTPEWEPQWDAADGGGIEPGHQAEWAKLLCQLHTHRDEAWLLERAVDLVEGAIEYGWDDERGGFVSSVDRDGTWVRTIKYRWPVTEGIGAAACLAQHDSTYWAWYDRFWDYATEHLINPKYGTWYRTVSVDNERHDPPRDPCFEPGYHPVNNAWAAMRVLEDG